MTTSPIRPASRSKRYPWNAVARDCTESPLRTTPTRSRAAAQPAPPRIPAQASSATKSLHPDSGYSDLRRRRSQTTRTTATSIQANTILWCADGKHGVTVQVLSRPTATH